MRWRERGRGRERLQEVMVFYLTSILLPHLAITKCCHLGNHTWKNQRTTRWNASGSFDLPLEMTSLLRSSISGLTSKTDKLPLWLSCYTCSPWVLTATGSILNNPNTGVLPNTTSPSHQQEELVMSTHSLGSSG